MSNQEPEVNRPAAIDDSLRRLREYVAAGIAGIVVVGTLVMVAMSFYFINLPDPAFSRVKDLLLFLNPLLGVVIGYYFNKVSTEARAESAELTARGATQNAQQAAEARNQAQAQAQDAERNERETRSVLRDMTQAADKMLAVSPAGATRAGIRPEEAAPGPDARLEMLAALDRAHRLLGERR